MKVTTAKKISNDHLSLSGDKLENPNWKMYENEKAWRDNDD